MTYDTQETSTHGGAPAELYEFRYATAIFAYTNGEQPITKQQTLFMPQSIRRGAITGSSEAAKQELQITVPRDVPIADLFRVSPPAKVVTLSIYRTHHTDGSQQFITTWQGRVLTANWQGDAVTLACESILVSIERKAPRRRYSIICPFELYGSECKANKTAMRVDGSVSAVSGNTISTTLLKPDDWFAGGYLEYDIPGSSAPGTLSISSSQADGTLVLGAVANGLIAGADIKAFAGCDHTLADCKTKFDNVGNYGGFPFFPSKNPFGSEPLY